MAGIIAPVVIHLWNSRQGRVLLIGSIDFLDKTSLKKARSRRLSDWWLLLLRCLLLILLALLLAGPFWKRRPDAGKKGWVLVSRGTVTGASQADSLVQKGFQRHDIEGASWWESFHALDQQAPEGIPFYVFTDGQLQHFSGNRPVTDRPVHWYVSAPGDSIVRWVAAAWKQGPDSMGVITGSSGATGTSYNYRAYGRDTTPVDTTTLRLAIYTDKKYTRDGQWVDGAVRALQQFTRRNIVISGRLDGADWVFWLSAKPVDIKAPNIVLYEPGRGVPADTWIAGSNIPVEKVTEQSRQWLPIWIDGFGRPLLALEETGSGRRYHFYSHFDPAWNGLVWSREFPIRMGELILPDEQTKGVDRRVIDPAQVDPSHDDSRPQDARVVTTSIDLSPFGWLLVFLALVVERILSKRTKDG